MVVRTTGAFPNFWLQGGRAEERKRRRRRRTRRRTRRRRRKRKGFSKQQLSLKSNNYH
jgi:hypothetical protein